MRHVFGRYVPIREPAPSGIEELNRILTTPRGSSLPDAKANALSLVAAAAVLAAGVSLVRSQVTVDSVDYMEGMIPHHSIAILTSERAGIDDARVRELADDIIAAQRREIAEMEWLIGDIRANGIATTQEQVEARPVPDFSN